MLCPDEVSTSMLGKSALLACILSDAKPGSLLPQGNNIHTPVHVLCLEPVEAKRVLCGGVSKDHVRVIEHVQAVECQWVDFQIVQRELGVDIKAHVCGKRAGQVLGQAWGRLSTH